MKASGHDGTRDATGRHGMLTRRRLWLGASLAAAIQAGWPRLAQASGPAWDGMAAELARIEAEIGGRLGVAILDVVSGAGIAHRGTERFPMCSTFKVLACGAVLARVDTGHEDLGRRICFSREDVVTYSPVTGDRAGGDGMTLADLCEAAMTRSDNTAGNLILASLGGPAAVTAFARRLGDGVTRLDRTETGLNEALPGDPRDTTAPGAMASNLQALVVGDVLSPKSRSQLAAWLLSNRTGDAKLRADLPPEWRVGDKTGGGGWGTTNDVAVLWPANHGPLVACVYLTETKASFDDCNAAIASVARAIRTVVGA